MAIPITVIRILVPLHPHSTHIIIITMSKKKLITGTIILLLLAVATVFIPVSKSNDTLYIYIDNDDTTDSVQAKIADTCSGAGALSAKVCYSAAKTILGLPVHSGRYAITSSTNTLQLLRILKNGIQSPVRLTIPSVRTAERLAEDLSKKLMMSKEDLLDYLENNDSCAKYGTDTATVISLFIPNTYEVYWNITPAKLLDKMQNEQKAFWNGDRMNKAAALGLTPLQVMTMASIIDEETANNAEKPMVAGMYYNRIQQDMPLQADPTIKFALKQFELHRIYHNMLTVKSPYNTYVNTGLPPGPIRIPSVAGIDAVLNLVHHDYLYMCAKEDFSGTHNFARTYSEHLKNAARYSKALNERNIK